MMLQSAIIIYVYDLHAYKIKEQWSITEANWSYKNEFSKPEDKRDWKNMSWHYAN